MRYVLITPARDEEAFIERTLDSVCTQTILPERWVIVDDGSTDETYAIASAFADRHPWITVLRRSSDSGRNFGGKATAFNFGADALRHLEFDVIGNLDADVSFEPDYLEYLLDQFAVQPRLGVAGTPMIQHGKDSAADQFFNPTDVFGACQMFRRECLDEIGGYQPIKWGGIDWLAVRSARMKGWETRSFFEKRFIHHRTMGATESNIFKARFEYGFQDFILGNHPAWQLFRFGYQLTRRPLILGGLLLMAGYSWGFISGRGRQIPSDVLQFNQREQLHRLSKLARKLLILRPQ